MTVEMIHFTCLDVGQGLGTFVEIFDEDHEDAIPTHTMLLDLGSLGDRKAGTASAAWVFERLVRMPQPTIDALFLSHADPDHFNLLETLLRKFDYYIPGKQTGRDTLLVRFVMYGGDQEQYVTSTKILKTNLIDLLDEYMWHNKLDDPVKTYNRTSDATSAMCSFRNAKTKPVYTVADTVDAYILTGNLASGDKSVVGGKASREYRKNSESLVVVLDAFGTQFLATGDATGASMYQCTQNISGRTPADKIDNIFATTVPHHGSARTAFKVAMIKPPNESAEQVVENFIEKINAKSVLASAGFGNSHKHPSAELLSYFWQFLPDDEEPSWDDPALGFRHFYTAYFDEGLFRYEYVNKKHQKVSEDWPSESHWYSVQTALPLYTSLYYVREHGDSDDNENDDHSDAVIPPNPMVTKNPLAKTLLDDLVRGVSWRYELRQGMNGEPVMSLTPGTTRNAVRRGWSPGPADGPGTAVVPAARLRRRLVVAPAAGLRGLREVQ